MLDHLLAAGEVGLGEEGPSWLGLLLGHAKSLKGNGPSLLVQLGKRDPKSFGGELHQARPLLEIGLNLFRARRDLACRQFGGMPHESGQRAKMLVEHRFVHVFLRRERGLELELPLNIRRHRLWTKVDHGIPRKCAQVGLVLRTWKHGREN